MLQCFSVSRLGSSTAQHLYLHPPNYPHPPTPPPCQMSMSLTQSLLRRLRRQRWLWGELVLLFVLMDFPCLVFCFCHVKLFPRLRQNPWPACELHTYCMHSALHMYSYPTLSILHYSCKCLHISCSFTNSFTCNRPTQRLWFINMKWPDIHIFKKNTFVFRHPESIVWLRVPNLRISVNS